MLTDYNDAYQKGDLETAEKAVTEYYSKTGQERPTTGPGSKSEMRKVFAAKKAQPTIPTGSISEKQLLLQRVRLLIFHLHRVVLLIF